MTTIDFQIPQQDLALLFTLTAEAMNTKTYDAWYKATTEAYVYYITKNLGDKTFPVWINRQIIVFQEL